MQDMTREELEEAIKEEQILQTNRVLRWIIVMVIGGCGSILAGGIVWGTLSRTVMINQGKLDRVEPKIEALEHWRERAMATSTPPEKVIDLDKRIQRIEDQNTMILEQLRRISGQ